jgi:hypothetical protein
MFGTGIRMDISANPTFKAADEDEPLLMEWPVALPLESVSHN